VKRASIRAFLWRIVDSYGTFPDPLEIGLLPPEITPCQTSKIETPIEVLQSEARVQAADEDAD
jgi:hypothetical protein